MKPYRILNTAETVWWVCGTMEPIRMSVIRYNAENPMQYSVMTNNGIPHTADIGDLFETEKEALEEWFNRMEKERKERADALKRTEQQIAVLKPRYEQLCEEPVKTWSTVTREATLSGADTSKSDITVVGSGHLRIIGGASVSRLTVKDGGKCQITNGKVDSVLVYGSGTVYLYGTTLMTNATVMDSGGVFIYNRAKLSTSDIKDHGVVRIYGSGSATDIVVCSKGLLDVDSKDASALNITIEGGGKSCIRGSAFINSMVVSSGGKLFTEPPYNIECLTLKEGAKINED